MLPVEVTVGGCNSTNPIAELGLLKSIPKRGVVMGRAGKERAWSQLLPSTPELSADGGYSAHS